MNKKTPRKKKTVNTKKKETIQTTEEKPRTKTKKQNQEKIKKTPTQNWGECRVNFYFLKHFQNY